MGIYRCEVRIISRGRGHSAIGASAYRNGLKMTDERTGRTFDFGRKERIDLSEVILPGNAPGEARDPQVLWGWLEGCEARSDAQLAREMTISIPHELDWSTGLGAVRAMARSQFVDRGYPVEISFHNYGTKPDGSRNWHAHLMAPTRALDDGGWATNKDRSLNKWSQLYAWREAWAEHANAALRSLGLDLQLDHRRAEDRPLSTPAADLRKELGPSPRPAQKPEHSGLGW